MPLVAEGAEEQACVCGSWQELGCAWWRRTETFSCGGLHERGERSGHVAASVVSAQALLRRTCSLHSVLPAPRDRRRTISDLGSLASLRRACTAAWRWRRGFRVQGAHRPARVPLGLKGLGTVACTAQQQPGVVGDVSPCVLAVLLG